MGLYGWREQGATVFEKAFRRRAFAPAVQFDLTGLRKVAQKVGLDLPREGSVKDKEVRLVIESEASVVEIGRSDNGQFVVDYHCLDMAEWGFSFVNLDPRIEQSGVERAGRIEDALMVVGPRQEQSDIHSSDVSDAHRRQDVFGRRKVGRSNQNLPFGGTDCAKKSVRNGQMPGCRWSTILHSGVDCAGGGKNGKVGAREECVRLLSGHQVPIPKKSILQVADNRTANAEIVIEGTFEVGVVKVDAPRKRFSSIDDEQFSVVADVRLETQPEEVRVGEMAVVKQGMAIVPEEA